jgi:hypothetical protein
MTQCPMNEQHRINNVNDSMPNERTNSKRKLTMFKTCFSHAVTGKKKGKKKKVFQFLALCVFGGLLMTNIQSKTYSIPFI